MNKNEKVERMKELVSELQKYSYEYYALDKPSVDDFQYDKLCDELEQLEKDTNTILAGSPLHKVQGYVVDGFKKVTHSTAMLSADKTKDPNAIKKFLGNNKWYGSYKIDGLTLVLRYSNGKLIQAITRGNGTIGEDVTEQCKFISDVPMEVSTEVDFEVRGECCMSWKEFERVNSALTEKYSHPRNLAAGTLRQLDLNVLKQRRLSFIVFELVYPTFKSKLDGLDYLGSIGFNVVTRFIPNKEDTVENCIELLKPEDYQYPVDGIIFEFDDVLYSKSLGETGHHRRDHIALKAKDDVYETTLRDIQWQTSKTGLINPVAIFDEVDLDGALTTNATLHNISYIEDLKLGIGDKIGVIRANMVIPRVEENYTKSGNFKIPEVCPTCGHPTEVWNNNGSKTLHCTNQNCKAQIVSKIIHSVSKEALNIDGMSEATVERFHELGFIESLKDIYYLKKHYNSLVNLDGFGKKSIDKLLSSIEASRKTTLKRFLYALNIPLIGKTQSKIIEKHIYSIFNPEKENDVVKFFVDLVIDKPYYYWNNLEDFGDKKSNLIRNYVLENFKEILSLAEEFTFEYPLSNSMNKPENSNTKDLTGTIWTITGDVHIFKNRKEIEEEITSKGGKVTGSVSKKTSYVMCNDVNSTSSKMQKAKELGIPIITEEKLINLIR